MSKDVLDELKKLLQAAGLSNIRFHDLRLRAARLLLSQGVHPKIVQELPGHDTIRMTMDVDSPVLPDMQGDAIHRLDAVLETDQQGDIRDAQAEQRWFLSDSKSPPDKSVSTGSTGRLRRKGCRRMPKGDTTRAMRHRSLVYTVYNTFAYFVHWIA